MSLCSCSQRCCPQQLVARATTSLRALHIVMCFVHDLQSNKKRCIQPSPCNNTQQPASLGSVQPQTQNFLANTVHIRVVTPSKYIAAGKGALCTFTLAGADNNPMGRHNLKLQRVQTALYRVAYPLKLAEQCILQVLVVWPSPTICSAMSRSQAMHRCTTTHLLTDNSAAGLCQSPPHQHHNTAQASSLNTNKTGVRRQCSGRFRSASRA